MHIPKEYIYKKMHIDGKAAANIFRLLYILKNNKIVLQKPRTHAMFGVMHINYAFTNYSMCPLL